MDASASSVPTVDISGALAGDGLDTTSPAATLGDNETPTDLCESFNVGRFDDPEIRARAYVAGAEATFCPNRWPQRPAGLRPLFERYYAVMERLCSAPPAMGPSCPASGSRPSRRPCWRTTRIPEGRGARASRQTSTRRWMMEDDKDS